MAVTTHTDMQINEDHFYGGLFEAMEQDIEGLAAGSRGAIVINDDRIKGDYGYDSFFTSISSLVERRVVDTVSAGTATQALEKEYVSVKVNRRAQVEWSLDAFKKKQLDPMGFSFVLGREFQRRKMQEMVNLGLTAAATALESQTALTKDVTGESTKTVTHTYINDAFAKRGDKANEIVAVAIHSKPYYNLIGQALSDKVPANIGGGAIMEGSVPIFGRSALVSDSSGLTDANGSLTDTYNTLGLVPGALIISQSEPETIVGADLVTGLHNLVYRFQAEWSYNIAVKGFQWDVANGGANPLDSAVATTTNWDQIDTSDKTLAGVLLVSQ
jgi:hypothetical protein